MLMGLRSGYQFNCYGDFYHYDLKGLCQQDFAQFLMTGLTLSQQKQDNRRIFEGRANYN